MKLVESMSRKAQKGDQVDDGAAKPSLPYDYDETYHQRDELKHLGADEWRQDGGSEEKDSTWRKHDGDYQVTVKWDDGGEMRYRWDVLDTDDRTVDSGHSDSIEDAKSDADEALKKYMETHKKESAAFKVAQEIDSLSNAADELFGDSDGVPGGQIAKAEWVASRMAERRMAKRVDDLVLNHLAGIPCKVGMVACAKLTDKKAYAEYKSEYEVLEKHASRKPRMKTKEARYKAWASRKLAFNGDSEIFVGAVANPSNGEWLKLPASDEEIDKAIEAAQAGPDGEYYEEVMISDTSGLGDSVGEYDNIRNVNEWIEKIEDADLDDDLIEAMLDEYDLKYVAENIDEVQYWMNVDDEEDLGIRIVEELGFDGINEDERNRYFDYEGFGRDIVTNDGYTISNGFAYRVASRTALACDMHDRMLVALFENRGGSALIKSAQQSGWNGEGWYDIDFAEGGQSWTNNGPIWLESEIEYDDELEAAEAKGSPYSEYLGNGDDPKSASVKEKLSNKVKTKVKTCGNMAGGMNPKRKASAMKTAQDGGYVVGAEIVDEKPGAVSYPRYAIFTNFELVEAHSAASKYMGDKVGYTGEIKESDVWFLLGSDEPVYSKFEDAYSAYQKSVDDLANEFMSWD